MTRPAISFFITILAIYPRRLAEFTDISRA
jgi:hypothetical protein